MAQALYRKYRSRSFDEVIGQDHITKTLRTALKTGRIRHAYLLTGPRGVGKTSVARILAHEVNNFPYRDESIHLDIIEIDAASNRRIDEIRELRERARTVPVAGKYKVYIIDEVHMLTREAFNALLKTLEEPPAHCIFILATTEAHKVPATIISRTQRFNFKPLSPSQGAAHLANIAKKENISITKQALRLLAEHGSGSFRDSISLLDQLSASDKAIDEESVRQTLGLAPDKSLALLIEAIAQKDSSQLLKIVEELRVQGINPAILAKELSQSLRTRLAGSQTDAAEIQLLKDLLEVPASLNPQESLEISLLTSAARPTAPKSAGITTSTSRSKPTATKNVKTTATEPLKASSGTFSLELWPDVVQRVKAEAASLYTALRLAVPSLDNDILTLAMPFPLHQKKVNQAKHKDLIGSLVEEISGAKLTIESVVEKSAASSAQEFKNTSKVLVPFTTKPGDSDDAVQNISNIFGSAEVLES